MILRNSAQEDICDSRGFTGAPAFAAVAVLVYLLPSVRALRVDRLPQYPMTTLLRSLFSVCRRVFVVVAMIVSVSSPSALSAQPAPAPAFWLGLLRLTPRLHDDSAWTATDRASVGAHFARLRDATTRGQVALAGRTNETGDRTLGLVVFKADDAAAAERFMQEDPAVVAGVMTAEVRPYSIALLRDSGRVSAGEEHAAIVQPAMDYALGWYEGDPARMEAALHPELAKREVVVRNGRRSVASMGAMRLVQGTRAGVGRRPEEERRMEIRVLDRWQDMAMVRLELSDWVDYLQVARSDDGRWQIVNVLWQTRTTESPGVAGK